MDTNGGLQYQVGLDTSQLMKDINKAKSGFDSLTNEAVKQGNEIQEAFDSVGASIKNTIANITGIGLGIAGVKSMVTSIASTRSYFQDIESSMKVFLGSAEKASEFTAKLKDYAWYNMFEFSDLAGASKQLIAYGNDVNNVIPIIDKLSNIAAGTGGELQHFVDMFNRAKSTGQVAAKDMYAWASAGVVLKDVMKDMGEEVAGSTLTFEQLNRALDHVTGEGGMFHGLMAEQAENLSSWWGALQDDMSTLLNDLGTKLQDPMTDAMKVAHNLMENYEEVLAVLKEVAIAFGTVKTASVLEGVYGKLKDEALAQEVENLKDLGEAYKSVLGDEQIAQVNKLGLTEGTQEYNDALKIQFDQLVKNADLEKQLADESLDKVEKLIKSRESELDIAKELEQNAYKQLQSAKGTGDAVAIETAERNLEVATMQRQSAEGKLVTAQEQKETAVRRQNTAAMQKEIIAKNADAVADKAGATSTNILTAAKTRLIGVFNKLKAAMLSNPFTAVAAAVTALGYAVYKLCTYETDAEKAQRELNEAIADLDKEQKKENATIDIMFDRLRKAKEGTQEYKDAKQAIIKQYGSYLEGQNAEIQNLKDLEGAYKAVTAAAASANREKKIAAVQDKAAEATGKAADKATQKAYDMFVSLYKGKENSNDLVKSMMESFNLYLDTGELTGQLKELVDGYDQNRQKVISQYEEKLKQAEAANDKQAAETYRHMVDVATKNEVFNPVGAIIREYQKTKAEWDKKIDDAVAQYGTAKLPKPADDVKEEYANLLDAYNKAQKAYEEATNEVAKMEANRSAYNTKQYEDAVLKAKNAKELFEQLGGQIRKQDKEKQEDIFGKSLNEMKAMYDQTQKWLSSTDKDVQKQGEEMYGKLKEQGTDYLDFLIKLRDKEWANLSEKDRATLTSAIAGETQPKEQKQEKDQYKDLLNNLLSEYEGYEQKKAKLKAEYLAKMQILIMAGAKDEAQNALEAYKKAMADLDAQFGKSILKNSQSLSTAMQTAAKQTKKSLKKSIDTLNAVIDYRNNNNKDGLSKYGITQKEADKLSLEEIKDIYGQLVDLQDEYDRRTQYPFRNLIEGFKKVHDANKDFSKGLKDESKRNEEIMDGFSKIKAGAGEAAGAIQKCAETLNAIADTVSDRKLANQLKGVSESMSFIGDVAQGFASGGLWGAVASAGSNIMNQITNDFVEKAQKEAQAKSELVDYQTQYNKLLSERNYLEQDYSGILGEDKLGRAHAAFAEAKRSIEEYDKFINKRAEQGGKNEAELTMQLFGFSGNPLEGLTKNIKLGEDKAWKKWLSMGLIGSTSTLASDMQDAYDRGLNNLQAQMIQRQERKWWKIGSKDRYTSLYDMAPEIWGGKQDGEFDVEAAQAFLDTHKDIDATIRSELEHAIELKNQEKEALEQVKQLAAEITGDMSSKMTDAIVNAVENGADAWGDFQSAGSDAIKALGRQMVESLIYQNYMKKYEKDIQDAIGEGNDEGLMKIIGDIGNEMPAMYEAGQQLLKTVYDKGEELGYQMYNIEQQNREAQAKGIAQASQDSIDELNGRMTAVQGHTFNISQNSTILAQRSGEILQVLMGIRTDTARLESIETNMANMSTDISWIRSKGVKAL